MARRQDPGTAVRRELWDTNSRLAERIEMRIKDVERAHRSASTGMAFDITEMRTGHAQHHLGADHQRLLEVLRDV